MPEGHGLVYSPGVNQRASEAKKRTPLPADASALEQAWSLQEAWSSTADALKRVPQRGRSAALTLLVTGAVAGAVGASAASGDAAQIWAVGAALALATAGLLDTFVASPDRDRDWTAARMASERYKAAVWRYLTGASPYDGSDDERDRELEETIDLIEHETAATRGRRMETYVRKLPGESGGDIVDLYLAKRVRGQIGYHTKAERRERQAGNRLRVTVLVLSAGGALMVSLSSIPSVFDDAPLAAWVAAVAAATGAVTSYSGAGRHHEIARSSAKIMVWLDRRVQRFNKEADREAAFPAFVDSIERVIASQNDTWADTIER